MSQSQMQGREFTEDALARRVYHLNTLYELNQEISALRDAREVLEASLLYIIGVFGLRRGLIALHQEAMPAPREYVSRGMRKSTAEKWFHQLAPLLSSREADSLRAAKQRGESPLSDALMDFQFRVWLPLHVDKQVQGHIILGEKLLEQDFSEDDLELLSTIGINVQNVLNNVMLIESLNQAITKETRIRNVFQRYAPEPVVEEVLNPTNEEMLLGESENVRNMFDEMIRRLEEQHALEQDLNLAHQVQECLLPDRPPSIPGIQIAARSIPARGVCGDYYDFIALGPHEVVLSLADIAGKGMAAGMIATMLQSATRMCVGSYYPIPAVLAILNRFVHRHTDTIRYATMFHAQLNAQEHTLTYSAAGHPPALLCRQGEIVLLEVGGCGIGCFEQWAYEQETIKLESGDALIIYSDGVTDAGIIPEMVRSEDAFGQGRLERFLIQHASLPAGELLESLAANIDEYASGRQPFDDITMIVVKVE